MRHVAARLLAVLSLAAFVVASCAHFNSPGGTLMCMENSKDEKAAEQLVFAMIDQDSTAALDAAFVLAPDLVKCLLQKAAALKSVGGVAGERAKKAQRYLDAHGLSSIFKEASEETLATGVGSWPNESPEADTFPVDPGADAPGVIVSGICPPPCGGPVHGVTSPGSEASTKILRYWVLPFEEMSVTVSVTAPGGSWPCGRGMRSYAWPPYAPETVCVTTNPTINLDPGLMMVGDELAFLSQPPGIGPGPVGG